MMLYNWIRAFIFPPFQFPKFKFDGKWMEVSHASPIYKKNKFEKPGTLVNKDNEKFIFSTQDCYIELSAKIIKKGY